MDGVLVHVLHAIVSDTTWGKLSSPGMFSFGSFMEQNKDKASYSVYEVPLFVVSRRAWSARQ